MEKQNDNSETLELYKLMVGSIQSNENKRLTVNAFYLSVISAIFSINNISTIDNLKLSFLLVILSVAWFFHIKCFRNLAKAKFEVIDELEEKLSYKMFKKEWISYKKINTKIEQTNIELTLISFSVVYSSINLILLCLKTIFKVSFIDMLKSILTI